MYVVGIGPEYTEAKHSAMYWPGKSAALVTNRLVAMGFDHGSRPAKLWLVPESLQAPPESPFLCPCLNINRKPADTRLEILVCVLP